MEEGKKFLMQGVPMWMVLAVIVFIVIVQFQINNINNQLSSAEQIFTQVYQKDVTQDSIGKELINQSAKLSVYMSILQNNDAQLWYKTLTPNNFAKIQAWFTSNQEDLATCAPYLGSAKIGSDFYDNKGSVGSMMSIDIEGYGNIVLFDNGTANCYLPNSKEPSACSEVCFGGLTE